MDSYQDILEWLYSQVSNYQNEGKSAYKPGFQNIIKLCNLFGNPQKQFKSIHIAGTNGKGSTSNMLASILKEAGYKVGLFTSPHLKNFTERIRVNGEECTQEFVYKFLNHIKKQFTTDFNPSFFELTTAMAFKYFADQKVDIAVIEVGLGGRLDSTNIINPEVSVITSISMDHTDLLGDTLEKIAMEKAGIIKDRIPLVIGEEKEEIKEILKQVAVDKNAPYVCTYEFPEIYSTDLKGAYQVQNMKTVIGVIGELEKKGFIITKDSIEKGFLKVKENMNFKGRWEIVQKENPLIIADIGHNEAGFLQITKQLGQLKYEKLRIVIGFVKGKDLDKIFPLLPSNAYYYFVQPSIERGLSPKKYEDKIKNYFNKYKIFYTVKEGLISAKSESSKKDIVFIGGSNFVVSEIF